METAVELERCILRAVTAEGYQSVLKLSGRTNGESSDSLLRAIVQHSAEVRLGQTIPPGGNCPAELSVIDLIPVTAGRLTDATTLIVLPPAAEFEASLVVDTPNVADDSCEACIDEDDTCIVLLDHTLSGTTALASRGFLLQTLLMDGGLVCVGDEEYSTAFVIAEDGQECDDAAAVTCTLRTPPDVFRNIRACMFLDALPSVAAARLRCSECRLRVSLSAFRGVLDATDTSSDIQLSSVVVVPAWPTFMFSALFGDTYEQFVTLALHASRKELHGRIIAEGDIVVLRVTPRLFVEQQSVCTDAVEAVLSRVAHFVQDGQAATSTAGALLHKGAIAIPLRVTEVTTSSGKSYGRLQLGGDGNGGTELLMSLRSGVPCADTTPLFPPPRPLRTFYAKLSLTTSIRDAMGSWYTPSQHVGSHVFVVHAVKENFPYECIATALAENGVEALIADLSRWGDEEVRELMMEYMKSAGGVSLIIKNAQQLPDRPQVLRLFDTNDVGEGECTGVRVIFLVCECVESPPPTVAARARNVGGVLKGTNPSDEDRLLIVSSLFEEAQQSLGLGKSLLLSFEAMASWTVGLSVADVVAYMQECVSLLSTMRVPDDVRPVLSESLCADVLQKFQKAHGHNLVSTKLQPVRWSDVGGLEEAKRELRETIQLPLLYPDLFRSGTKRRAGILFYGPPGCGKTLLAKAVATEMNMNFMAVKGPELINQYVGESEKNIRLLFQRARDNSPCIIFFDELDALAPARGAKGDAGGAMDRVVAQLLVEVDGVGHTRSDGSAAGQVFIIGATNRPDLLDPSLLRPGRFDRLCYLGIPGTRDEQLVALRALTRKFELADDVDFEALLEPMAPVYTGADLFALCSDAMMFAVEAMLESAMAVGAAAPGAQQQDGSESPRLIVRMGDFLRARAQLKPSVTPDDLRRYEAMRTKFTTS